MFRLEHVSKHSSALIPRWFSNQKRITLRRQWRHVDESRAYEEIHD